MSTTTDTPVLLRPRAVSFAIAIALGIAATLQFRGGVTAVPDPVVELLRALFEYPPELCARLIAAATAAGAVAILCFGVLGGNRFLPIAACGVAAFVSLACVSRAISAGGLGFPALSLVVSGTLLFVMLRTRGASATDPSTDPSTVSAATRSIDSGRRGLSPAWTALGLIALATATGAIAGRATDPNRPDPAAQNAPAASKVVNIDLDMHPYVGRRIEDTPIANYLPSLPALVRGKTTFVVFSMPNCNACQSIYRQFFSMPRLEQVFKVEIPPADGVPNLSSGEEAEQIECVGCETLALAPGPNYLVATPMVVKIEDSVVTCVSDRFKGECLLPQ